MKKYFHSFLTCTCSPEKNWPSTLKLVMKTTQSSSKNLSLKNHENRLFISLSRNNKTTLSSLYVHHESTNMW